jgi:diamine N-acetyltransferase
MGLLRRVSIERIDESGLSRVQALARRIWPECFAYLQPQVDVSRMVEEIYHLDTLRDDMRARSHQYWVVQVDGEDAGYASAYRDGDRLWIKKLYLLESSRGLGLGKRLIDTALAAFAGVAATSLYVNDGNLPAIAFYRSQGFEIESSGPVRMGPFQFRDHVMTRTRAA